MKHCFEPKASFNGSIQQEEGEAAEPAADGEAGGEGGAAAAAPASGGPFEEALSHSSTSSFGVAFLRAKMARVGDQVIPTPSYLAHFSPVSPRCLRVFTVSPRRFRQAPSRNPRQKSGQKMGHLLRKD